MTEFKTDVAKDRYEITFTTDNEEYYHRMQDEARRCIDDSQNQGVAISFNIKAIKKDEQGNYIGLVGDNGFVLQYNDEHGKPISFNKEIINKLCGIEEDEKHD